MRSIKKPSSLRGACDAAIHTGLLFLAIIARSLRRGNRLAMTGFYLFLLTGCLSSIWTGATLIYGRHNIYHTLSDYELLATANRVLFYKKSSFECDSCYMDVAVLNGDILLVGYLPTEALCQEAYKRISAIEGYRRIINKLSTKSAIVDPVKDSWITTKIRSQIIADSDIDPQQFKVVTMGGIVYLMGDVIPSQAGKVIAIAKETEGVISVVTLFKYYHLSDK